MKITFVITTDGRDIFADMALVSMLSARLSNPDSPIVVLCDGQSAAAIRAQQHAILDVCDELIAVDTPNGSPTFRNRTVKSQVGNFVDGPFIYVDADVLLRKSLQDLPNRFNDVGGVANHNSKLPDEQVWSGDLEVLNAMNWPKKFDPVYINGGVIFSNGSEAAMKFWKLWPKLYKDCYDKFGSARDQPSLNSALSLSGVNLNAMPDHFNAQVLVESEGSAIDATIWHFYFSLENTNSNIFEHLLANVERSSIQELKLHVAKAIKRRTPWTRLSPVHDVERCLWGAYRNGTKLSFGEIVLLLQVRANWKNMLIATCNTLGLSYRWFAKSVELASRTERLLWRSRT